MDFDKAKLNRPTDGQAAEEKTLQPKSGPAKPRLVSALDPRGRSLGQIDVGLLDITDNYLPRSPLIDGIRAQLKQIASKKDEVISRIVERFPDILDGKVRVLENTVVLVVDFVRSTELIQELERANKSQMKHFNGLFSAITAPIKDQNGYPIGFHGDSVHALFLGEQGLRDAQVATQQIVRSWVFKCDPMTPNLRIGLAQGRVELGLLGASGDRRIEPMGSPVNEAFRAASGIGSALSSPPNVRVFLGDSIQRNRCRAA